jgi:hypothetical protein
MPTAPQGGTQPRRRRVPRDFIPRRDWRRPLTTQVQFRGGPEAKILIRARGREWYFAGHETILDCLMEVWEADEAVTDP